MKYIHPVSGTEIEGVRLAPGNIIQEGDVYDSTDGTWRDAPCPGAEIQPGSRRTIIVRPANKISQGHQWILSQSFDMFAHDTAKRRTPKGAPLFLLF